MWDKELMCSNQQDLSQVAGTYYSEGSVDLGAIGTRPYVGGSPIADLMRGGKLEFVVQVTETFVSGTTNSTLVVSLVGSNTATDLSDGIAVYDTSLTIAEATLVAGYEFFVDWPLDVAKRYIGCRYVIGVATTTAGKISAGFQFNRNTAHPR